MTSKRVHFRDSDDGDWTALYVDGVKVDEGHSLTPGMVLEALGIPFTSEEIKADPYGDSFPDKLEDASDG